MKTIHQQELLLNFLFDISLGEHHDPTKQVLEGDASLGAAAALV